jgi:hypothetical protein
MMALRFLQTLEATSDYAQSSAPPKNPSGVNQHTEEVKEHDDTKPRATPIDDKRLRAILRAPEIIQALYRRQRTGIGCPQ